MRHLSFYCKSLTQSDFTAPRDLGFRVVLKPLQIEVCIHFSWFAPPESSLVYEITQKQNNTDFECSKVNSEICPETCLDPKEKRLAVDPEEAVSTRTGTVEYFIANTIFCRIEALMRNNWNQSLPVGDRGDTQWRASLCIKPQRGFNSSLGGETEMSLSSVNVTAKLYSVDSVPVFTPYGRNAVFNVL